MKPTTLVQRVYQYCESHMKDGKKSIVKHFMDENTPKSTIYYLIDRWEKGLPTERKQGSGRKPKINDKKNVLRLADMINNQTGISTRKLAKKFKRNQFHIVKILVVQNKTDIQFRKKILVPDDRAEAEASHSATMRGNFKTISWAALHF